MENSPGRKLDVILGGGLGAFKNVGGAVSEMLLEDHVINDLH